MTLNFQKYAAEGDQFIQALAKELGYPEDKARAGRVLKVSLHGLRSLISVNESLQLISQFPMFLKAVYVDQWNLHKTKKKIKHMEDFIDELIGIDGSSGEHDFPSREEAEKSLNVLFNVLRRYVSLGELKDIETGLPKELKTMLRNNVLMI